MKSFNYCDDTVINNSFQAMAYWHFKLRDAAKSYIQYFAQQTEFNKLMNKLLEKSIIEQNKKQMIKLLIQR